MRIAALIMFVASAGAAAPARKETPAVATRNLIVCVESSSAVGIWPAEALASKMFAAIGVTVDWRRGLRGCPPQALQMSMNCRTPETLMPGATAYALPFEGVHINIFYDRIVQQQPKRLVGSVLAHVMVHEITHLLEGISRHSASGVMKLRWDLSDFEIMAVRPLPFAQEDIDWILHGLALRASAGMAQ